MTLDITSSPFYQADSSPDAQAVQAQLADLAAGVDLVDSAAVALRAGGVSGDQRDALLAAVLDLTRKILNVILGRSS